MSRTPSVVADRTTRRRSSVAGLLDTSPRATRRPTTSDAALCVVSVRDTTSPSDPPGCSAMCLSTKSCAVVIPVCRSDSAFDERSTRTSRRNPSIARAGAGGALTRSSLLALISVHHRRELLGRAHLNDPDRALLCVGEAVRDERVQACTPRVLVEHGLEHRAAAGRYLVRLDAVQSVARIAVR